MAAYDREAVLRGAADEGARWLNAVRFDGVTDLDAIVRALRPWACVWDYYLAAFYECAQHQLIQSAQHEFIRTDSLLPAIQAGMGYLINLGSLLVAVCRPEAHRDEQMRIHSATTAAIRWGEQQQWWWHGVRVEGEWIESPDAVDPALYWAETNQERRRALAEILGWERVLAGRVKPISSDAHGALVEVELQDDAGRPARFCDVACPSTGRRYLLRVPPATKTCRAGLAWTFGLKPTEYALDLET